MIYIETIVIFNILYTKSLSKMRSFYYKIIYLKQKVQMKFYLYKVHIYFHEFYYSLKFTVEFYFYY